VSLEWVPEAAPIVISAIALTTSLYTFRLTGSFVRVRATPNLVVYGSDGKAQPGQIIGVTASNIGRTEVEVTVVGFISGRRPGRSVGLVYPPIGPPLPFTLRPGHSQRWHADHEDLRKKVTKRPVRAFVTLGNDRTRKTRKFNLDSDVVFLRDRMERWFRRWFM
jgi:hypothetical protein